MKLIRESELKQLLKDSERLRRLESFGVEWSGYELALFDSEEFDKSYDDWVDIDLDGLVDEYESLEHYIEFNY